MLPAKLREVSVPRKPACLLTDWVKTKQYITRAYVNRRGPRRKGVNIAVILSSLSLMAASLLALLRGHINNASSYSSCSEHTFFQKTIAQPFGKQVSVSGEDYLCVAELRV